MGRLATVSPMRSLMTRTRVLAATAIATGMFATGCSSDVTVERPADAGVPGSISSDAPPSTGAGTDAGGAGSLLRATGLDDVAEAVESTAPSTAGRVLVEELEQLPLAERPSNLMAQVRADRVVLTDDAGGEAGLALPVERFYLSVAPYLQQTHPCGLHSLTTCRGELPATDVEVVVRDAVGSVVLEKSLVTQQNGFVGLWLPAGIRGTVRMQARIDGESVSGEAPFGSASDDDTCLTTLQLA